MLFACPEFIRPRGTVRSFSLLVASVEGEDLCRFHRGKYFRGPFVGWKGSFLDRMCGGRSSCSFGSTTAFCAFLHICMHANKSITSLLFPSVCLRVRSLQALNWSEPNLEARSLMAQRPSNFNHVPKYLIPAWSQVPLIPLLLAHRLISCLYLPIFLPTQSAGSDCLPVLFHLIRSPLFCSVLISGMATLSFVANGVLSALGGVISYHIILDYIPVFINKHMCGKDLCKVINYLAAYF